jgi:hypothetical protein
MKKIVIHILLCILSNLAYTANSQAQASVNIIIGEAARQSDGSCGSSGRGCPSNIQAANTANIRESTTSVNSGKAYLNTNNELVLFIPKATISSTLEEFNFKNKSVYFIEKDVLLSPELAESLAISELMMLQKGMYPIIDWTDGYFVSFILKKVK